MLFAEIRKQIGAFSLQAHLETEGGCFGILGASGAGKTLALKCIAGLERPDSGRIVLNGRVLFDSAAHIDLPPRERRVGYLFQQYALFPNMTAAQNIAMGLHRLPGKERAAVLGELLRSYGLETVANRYPHQLSGGEQQRTALARIMAAQPELILLDEPFSALDGCRKDQMMRELDAVLHSFAGEAVLVTHNAEEASDLCRRICVMSAGKTEGTVSPSELFRTPGTMSAAMLAGCRNFSRGEFLGAGSVRCPDWGVILKTAAPVPEKLTWVGIRSEEILFEGVENPVVCRLPETPEGSCFQLLETPGGGALCLKREQLPRWAWEQRELTAYLPPQALLLLTGDRME